MLNVEGHVNSELNIKISIRHRGSPQVSQRLQILLITELDLLIQFGQLIRGSYTTSTLQISYICSIAPVDQT
jgi:hypothetical protein